MEADRAQLHLVQTGSPQTPVPSPSSPRPHPAALRLLSLDAHGRVLDWINWQDATCLYARGAVAWTLGDPCLHVHGGVSRLTGEQSLIELHPIVASRGHARAHALSPTPTLTNTALFARDAHLCLYCGQALARGVLTRDARDRRLIARAPVGVAEPNAHDLAVCRARLDGRGDGVLAVVMAAAAMLGYIWWRFEWNFAIGAIVVAWVGVGYVDNSPLALTVTSKLEGS